MYQLKHEAMGKYCHVQPLGKLCSERMSVSETVLDIFEGGLLERAVGAASRSWVCVCLSWNGEVRQHGELLPLCVPLRKKA